MWAPTYYVTLGPLAMDKARRMLANGHSLAKAAFEVGVLARDLDVALWRNIGDEMDVPLESRWLGNRAPDEHWD